MTFAEAVNFAPATDKQAIADAFSRASSTYDAHAEFQRQVGQQLLARMPADLSNQTILDLGCGTGYFSQKLRARGARVICVDISSEMLCAARQRCGVEGMHYLCADAEDLPIENHTVDYVFSSLALQWCADLSIPLKEIKRVTKQSGRAFFSTLLDGSLSELKQAWSEVDNFQHVNDFVSSNQVNIALAQARCNQHELNCVPMTIWYESAFALMRDLKGIGAGHVEGRSHALTGRKALVKVEHAYQAFRTHQGLLPASYQVCIGEIHL